MPRRKFSSFVPLSQLVTTYVVEVNPVGVVDMLDFPFDFASGTRVEADLSTCQSGYSLFGAGLRVDIIA